MTRDNKHPYLFLYGLVTALIIMLIGDNFIREGIFIDGLWYTTIAHNMAQGIGSTWQPAGRKPMINWAISIAFVFRKLNSPMIRTKKNIM